MDKSPPKKGPLEKAEDYAIQSGIQNFAFEKLPYQIVGESPVSSSMSLFLHNKSTLALEPPVKSDMKKIINKKKKLKLPKPVKSVMEECPKENISMPSKDVTSFDKKNSSIEEVLSVHGTTKRRPPVAFQISKWILDSTPSNTILSLLEKSQQPILLVYDDSLGYYQRFGRNEFPLFLARRMYQTDMEPYLDSLVSKEVFRHLLYDPKLQADYDDFDKADRYLNFLNCVVDLKTRKTLPHNSGYKFLSSLQAVFDPNCFRERKEPKAFNTMLERHFPCSEDRMLFLESLAYLISWKRGLKTAFFWIGEPHTGKSTYARILTELLDNVVTHHSLKQLSSKHGPADLEGARVNICSEVDRTKITNLDNFKTIVGNDVISVEPKFQKLRAMKCRTNLLLIGNAHIPLAEGLGEPAIYDRIAHIRLQNPYTPEEMVPLFDERLLTKEMTSIVALLVHVLCDLSDRDYRFTHSALSDKEKRQFIRKNSPESSIEGFVEDDCVADHEAFSKCADIYAAYKRYCERNEHEMMSKGKFFREFPDKMQLKPKKRRDSTDGRQYRGYKGIRLK